MPINAAAWAFASADVLAPGPGSIAVLDGDRVASFAFAEQLLQRFGHPMIPQG